MVDPMRKDGCYEKIRSGEGRRTLPVGRGVGRARAWIAHAQAKLSCSRGQGTTEYAILVGVLVVIAIIAITLFRPKLEELWNAIATGINGL